MAKTVNKQPEQVEVNMEEFKNRLDGAIGQHIISTVDDFSEEFGKSDTKMTIDELNDKLEEFKGRFVLVGSVLDEVNKTMAALTVGNTLLACVPKFSQLSVKAIDHGNVKIPVKQYMDNSSEIGVPKKVIELIEDHSDIFTPLELNNTLIFLNNIYIYSDNEEVKKAMETLTYKLNHGEDLNIVLDEDEFYYGEWVDAPVVIHRNIINILSHHSSIRGKLSMVVYGIAYGVLDNDINILTNGTLTDEVMDGLVDLTCFKDMRIALRLCELKQETFDKILKDKGFEEIDLEYTVSSHKLFEELMNSFNQDESGKDIFRLYQKLLLVLPSNSQGDEISRHLNSMVQHLLLSYVNVDQ